MIVSAADVEVGSEVVVGRVSGFDVTSLVAAVVADATSETREDTPYSAAQSTRLIP